MSSKVAFGPHPSVPISSAVKAGDWLFLSGQIPFGADGKLVGGDIETQAVQVFVNLAHVLEMAGASLDDVVKTTVWLTDPADFSSFNAIYKLYFPKDPPARSCVVSKLMVDAKVEIEAVAYIPPGKFGHTELR